MTESLTETKKKCVNLLVEKRGDERYRGWAEGAVERFVHRFTNGNLDTAQDRADNLLSRLESSQPITLVMTGGIFFTPKAFDL